MQILEVGEPTALIESLKHVHLRGEEHTFPYAGAAISAEQVRPESLLPTSYYVLRGNLDRLKEIRDELLEQGYDLLGLDRRIVLEVRGEEIPLAPPIVEEYWEVYPERRRTRVVVDGLHRVMLAKNCGEPISVVVIRDPTEPLVPVPLSWEDVAVVDDLEGLKKRRYRFPEVEKFPFGRYPQARELSEEDRRYFFYRELGYFGSSGIRGQERND